MAPYDVLVDPVSIPDHPLLDTKSESEDRGEHIDNDPSFKTVCTSSQLCLLFFIMYCYCRQRGQLGQLNILW